MSKTLVKICGIKSVDEARAVLEIGANFSANMQNGINFIGVIFAPSKRQVTPQIARDIANLAHKFNVACVGVFGGQSSQEVAEICEFAGLDIAQLHGEFDHDLKALLAARAVKIWKAYSVEDELPQVDFFMCDMALFDCKGANLGGNGTSFEWGLLENLEPFSFGLAGGIGEENVQEALKFKPAVIDINSKVEDENLQKIPKKIERILKLLHKTNL